MRDPRPISSAPTLPVLFYSFYGVLFLALAAGPARAVRSEEIPSPRPAGWSVDLTGRVPQETLARIDRLGDRIKAANGAELAVVAVGTTGGVPSRAFATRLFNTWGIGERGKDNGVLVFAALDDRKVEIVLGRGLATPPLVRASQAIVQDEMVPLFRQGDPGGALLSGAEACAQRLLDVAPLAPAPPAEPAEEAPAPAPAAPPAALPAPAPAPLAVPQDGTGAYLGGGLALLALGGLGWGGYKLATRLHYCPQCHTRMDRLAPEAAAAHLTPVEQTEDRLGSVTIAVFCCPGCGTVDRRRHNNLFSGHQTCPECGAVAVRKRRWTAREATYAEDGVVQTEWKCLHCPYETVSTSITPRLVHSVDTSSSYSDSSSSSSSSDSGFGGGSSGGDGASGSW